MNIDDDTPIKMTTILHLRTRCGCVKVVLWGNTPPRFHLPLQHDPTFRFDEGWPSTSVFHGAAYRTFELMDIHMISRLTEVERIGFYVEKEER